jgi:hypothetical protein
MEMWSDLRQFDKVALWAQSNGKDSAAVDALRVQQAQWNEEVRDYRAAAETYLENGHNEKAVALLTKYSMDWAYLLGICRRLDRCRLHHML